MEYLRLMLYVHSLKNTTSNYYKNLTFFLHKQSVKERSETVCSYAIFPPYRIFLFTELLK